MGKSVQFLELLSGERIPVVLLGTWIVMAILLVVGALARRALAGAANPLVPDDGLTLRSLVEAFVEWIDDFAHGVMQTHGYRDLVPYIGSLFLFIMVANLFGLIPGMEPPTSFSDLTFALGAISFAMFLIYGFKENGWRYLRSYLGPILLMAPLMLPIEVADNLFRPFSLGIRLYANMFADHQVLSLFTNLTKLVIPIAFYALGSIVAVIQAIIFTVLTMSYIKLASSHDH